MEIPTITKNLLWVFGPALLAFVLVMPAFAQPSTNLRFCYQDIELFPNYVGDSPEKPADKPGVNIEMLELVAARVGLSITFMRYSWNRCLALLKAGRADSVIASYNEARAAIAAYPIKDGTLNTEQRITTSGYYLYHQNATPLWDGQRFLKSDIVIAAPRGYSIVADLRAKNIEVVEASTAENLLALLQFNRVDAVAAPGRATDAVIRREITRYVSVIKDPAPLKESPYFIVFSHAFYARNREIVEAVWQASEAIRQSDLRALTEKY